MSYYQVCILQEYGRYVKLFWFLTIFAYYDTLTALKWKGIRMQFDRRDFLKFGALAAAKTLIDQTPALAMSSKPNLKEDLNMAIPKRKLGKTGRELSIIGMGGLVVARIEQARADKIVADAVAAGVNYFDIAPSYHDAQSKLGPALKPYRDKAFLACKSGARDKAGLEKELNESLQLLQTDHFDLYQLHGITDVEKDVHAALGKGGAMEAILEAKKQGKLKYIGFSAHTPAAALTAMREFDFDTILYPTNFTCHFRKEFDTEVLAEAKKRNMGILALKAMARRQWPKDAEKKYQNCWYEPIDEPELARLALSWTLSQGITAALPPGDEKLFRMALELAPKCKPPTPDEIALLQKTATETDPLFPIVS
jgi:aryl-alcohol dehydrogenase-like predicted oxidoreductase